MSPAPDDRNLADALLQLSCVLEGIKSELSRRVGLTPQQAQLLTTLETEERTHGELANLLHCDKTNVTGLVDRLERRQLIRRKLDPNDRRVTRVLLTTQGNDLVSQFRDAVTAAIADHLSEWPVGRRGELVDLARASTAALRG